MCGELLSRLPLAAVVIQAEELTEPGDLIDDRELRASSRPLSPILSVRYANRAALQLFGQGLANAVHKQGLSGLSVELTDTFREFLAVCLEGVPRDRYELVLQEALRSPRTLMVSASPMPDRSAAVFFEDITALRRAEAGATGLTQFLDSIIEHIPAMVFVKDAKNLRFERFNRAGEELLGLSRRTLLGKTDYDFFPKQQADFFVEKDRKVLRGRTLEDIPEEPIDTPTGTRYLHTRKIPLLGDDGEPQHLLGISLDITEQKLASALLSAARDDLEQEVAARTAELRHQIEERIRAEQALAEAEEQLRHAQKMEAIGRLAGGVAHDFNNLLSVVISYSDLLLLRLPPSDRSRAEIEEIRKAGQRAAGLTRQLLAFSRQQVLKPRVLNLNDVVHGIEHMLSRVLGEDISLAIETEARLHRVKADPSQIEQVIMNLVVNARDAMPSGGRLRIVTANVPALPADVAVSMNAAGEHVLIRVSDTGLGMDDDTLARIFEPFFTTKERGKGTGLGLSTVFGIVKQSGGTVRVESQLGGGATFDVYLPVTHEEDAGPTLSRERESGEDLRGRGTVLLAEDDAQVRTMTAKVLRQYGYDVLEASRPSEAIALAASHRARIDLLLTDVVMPEMGGRLLAEHLSSTCPGLKVLFMSGYTDDSVMRHGVSEATVSFIHKPFSPEALARQVQQALAGRIQVDGIAR